MAIDMKVNFNMELNKVKEPSLITTATNIMVNFLKTQSMVQADITLAMEIIMKVNFNKVILMDLVSTITLEETIMRGNGFMVKRKVKGFCLHMGKLTMDNGPTI